MSDRSRMTEPQTSRYLDRLLDSYIAAYRTGTSKTLLFLAIPLLVWSVLALLLAVPRPTTLAAIPGASFASLAVLASVAACLALSWRLAVGLACGLVASLAGAHAYVRFGSLPSWQMALAVLALGSLLLIVGQRIGGRPASPGRMVRDLLVGPLWVLSQLYRALGLKT